MQRVVKFEIHSQPYWNNYFNSGRYFNSGCEVKLSLKFILNHYWNNYFNTGRYFNSGCDVKLSLKFILNHYWNNYFNSGRYFNSGCNTALMAIEQWEIFNEPHLMRHGSSVYNSYLRGPVTLSRTPISRTRGDRSTSTPPRRYRN